MLIEPLDGCNWSWTPAKAPSQVTASLIGGGKKGHGPLRMIHCNRTVQGGDLPCNHLHI